MGYNYYGITRPTTIKKMSSKSPMHTGLPGNYRNVPFCLEEGDRPRVGYTSTLPWGQISGSFSAEFILDNKNVSIHDNTTKRHNVYTQLFIIL